MFYVISDPYEISVALSLAAFAWKQVKWTDEAPRRALLIRAGFSAHRAVGRSLTHTFSSHALLVLPWGEIEGDTLHRPRAPHHLWQQAFFFFFLELSGWLSWAAAVPVSPSVSSLSALIQNSGAHLTGPQQESPAIWPHLHVGTPAANETLWKSWALMLVSPATDSSYISDSGALRAKALNCCLEILDSFKRENH